MIRRLIILLLIVGCISSLELIEPVNFPLYEFSGRSEGEDAPHKD